MNFDNGTIPSELTVETIEDNTVTISSDRSNPNIATIGSLDGWGLVSGSLGTDLPNALGTYSLCSMNGLSHPDYSTLNPSDDANYFKNTHSDLKLTVTSQNGGTLKFKYTGKSEINSATYADNYDYFVLLVDGTDQKNETYRKFHTRGENHTEWTEYSLDLNAGEHTIIFRYHKDFSTDTNPDRYCIDDITLDTTWNYEDYLAKCASNGLSCELVTEENYPGSLLDANERCEGNASKIALCNLSLGRGSAPDPTNTTNGGYYDIDNVSCSNCSTIIKSGDACGFCGDGVLQSVETCENVEEGIRYGSAATAVFDPSCSSDELSEDFGNTNSTNTYADGSFDVSVTGIYEITVYGAQGGSGGKGDNDGASGGTGAKGSKYSAKYQLKKGAKLYLYAGAKGRNGEDGNGCTAISGGAGGASKADGPDSKTWKGNSGTSPSNCVSGYGGAGGGGGGASLVVIKEGSTEIVLVSANGGGGGGGGERDCALASTPAKGSNGSGISGGSGGQNNWCADGQSGGNGGGESNHKTGSGTNYSFVEAGTKTDNVQSGNGKIVINLISYAACNSSCVFDTTRFINCGHKLSNCIIPDNAVLWRPANDMVEQTIVNGEWSPSNIGQYSASDTATPCAFKCLTGNYNSDTNSCVTEQDSVDCVGLIANAHWNTASSIHQTWNGIKWIPSEIGTYNEEASTTECRFVCNDTYLYDFDYHETTVKSCIKQRYADCTGLPANAHWIATGNTAQKITQNWNGTSWTPNTTGIHADASAENRCYFDCDTNFTWSDLSQKCESDSQPANCTGKPANSEWYSTHSDSKSITQTWNGTQWTPSNAAVDFINQYPFSSDFDNYCYYWCKEGFHRKGSECIKNDKTNQSCNTPLPTGAYWNTVDKITRYWTVKSNDRWYNYTDTDDQWTPPLTLSYHNSTTGSTSECWFKCGTGPNGGEYSGNDTSCQYCGDSATQTAVGEKCDKGSDNKNDWAGSEAARNCKTDCSGWAPYCGDNHKDDGHEQCDEGAANNKDDWAESDATKHCNASCTGYSPYCGDGTKNGPELCDNGTANNSNDWASSYAARNCKTDCSGDAPYCGDGNPDSGYEQCDNGPLNSNDWRVNQHCKADCSGLAPYCGDNIFQTANESCEIVNGTIHYLNNSGADTVIDEAAKQCIASKSRVETTLGQNYSGDSGTEYIYSGTIEEWSVPKTGIYEIEVHGAKGGDGYYKDGTIYSGCAGAKVTAKYALKAGQKLKLLAGKRGGQSTQANYIGGGGGGGSFVVLCNDNSCSTPTPLVIAGGGGGGKGDTRDDCTPGQTDSGTGADGTSVSNAAHGGKGWSSNTAAFKGTTSELYGYYKDSTANFPYGGFGGGGYGCLYINWSYGGGGGGYTGGDAGTQGNGGKGGTSYYNTDDAYYYGDVESGTTSYSGSNSNGNGKIVIKFVGYPNCQNSCNMAKSYAACVGSNTATCTGKPEGTTTWWHETVDQTWNSTTEQWEPETTAQYSATDRTDGCFYHCDDTHTRYNDECVNTRSGQSCTYSGSTNPPANAQWWNATISQDWTPANDWQPSTAATTASHSSTQPSGNGCYFHCIDEAATDKGYKWENNQCVARTQTANCSTLSDSFANAQWIKSTFTQTWNGSAWDPATKSATVETHTTDSGSTVECSFKCIDETATDKGYKWENNQCVAKTKKVACTGLIGNATWVNGEFTQTWEKDNANAWGPTTHSTTFTTDSNVECSYTCKSGFHTEDGGGSCISNSDSQSCTGTLPTNAEWTATTSGGNGTSSKTVNRTWDNGWTPSTDGVWGGTDGNNCQYRCKANYHREGNECVYKEKSGTCEALNVANAEWNTSGTANPRTVTRKWTPSDNSGKDKWTSNDGSWSSLTPTHDNSATPSSNYCWFKCKDETATDKGYEWKNNQCVAKTKKVDCTDLPTNAQWVNGKFTQTWEKDNANAWGPTTHSTTFTTDSNVECSYTCKSGFHTEDGGSTCVSNTNTGVTCGGILPTNATWWNGGTYTQTWNGDAWTTVSANYSAASTTEACAYKCSDGYHTEDSGSTCISNSDTQSCKYNSSTNPPTNAEWTATTSGGSGTSTKTVNRTWNNGWNLSTSGTWGGIDGNNCQYRCKSGYHRSGSTCVSNAQKTTSCGSVPAGGIANTVSSAKQDWSPTDNSGKDRWMSNYGSWTPAATWSYNTTASTTECHFKCGSGYSNNGNSSCQHCGDNAIQTSAGEQCDTNTKPTYCYKIREGSPTTCGNTTTYYYYLDIYSNTSCNSCKISTGNSSYYDYFSTTSTTQLSNFGLSNISSSAYSDSRSVMLSSYYYSYSSETTIPKCSN